MKKALILVLLVAIAAPIFADDALVLPAGVIRTYVVPTYAFASKAFGNGGQSDDLNSFSDFGGTKDKFSVFNLGMALEYGVNDWISAAVQWTPGWNASTKYETDAAAITSDLNLKGMADLFVGAKLQIVGPKAPIPNEVVRFAFAPGVKIPLGGADFEKQFANLNAGKDATLLNADKQILGVGARVYFDYVVNEMFFANLYSQFIYYPSKVKAVDASFADYGAVDFVRTNTPLTAYDPSLAYGYDLTMEFEPHFETMVSDGLQFAASAQFTYSMSPAVEASDDDADFYAEAKPSGILNVTPNVSLFFMKTFLPLELKIAYQYPIAGRNSEAINAVIFQLKAYAKF